MTDVSRRKILAVLALAVAAPVQMRAASATGSAGKTGTRQVQIPRPCPAIAPAQGTDWVDEDPLLHGATEWVDQLRQRGQTTVLYPVSRLQREFLIGYMRTCALADTLAQRGEWTILFMSDGTRCALIQQQSHGPLGRFAKVEMS